LAGIAFTSPFVKLPSPIIKRSSAGFSIVAKLMLARSNKVGDVFSGKNLGTRTYTASIAHAMPTIAACPSTTFHTSFYSTNRSRRKIMELVKTLSRAAVLNLLITALIICTGHFTFYLFG